MVSHKISVNLMPFDVRADFVKVTSDTVLVPVTIQIKNRDVTFQNKDGVERGTVNIFGRVTTLTGKIVQTFEDTVQVDVPVELLPKTAENSSVYWKALPLRISQNRYRLDIVVKDVNGDRTGSWSHAIVIPDFSEDKLSSSTLIIADQMEPVATKNVGTGNFVIGTTKVRPRVAPSDGKPISFKRNQKMNFWMQVYNLSVDEKTHKPSATFEYNVTDANNKAVIHTVESTDTDGQCGRPGHAAEDAFRRQPAAGLVQDRDQSERQPFQADGGSDGDLRRGVNCCLVSQRWWARCSESSGSSQSSP